MMIVCPHQVNLATKPKYTMKKYQNCVVANAGRAEGSLQVEFKGSSLLLYIFGIIAVIVAVQTTVIFALVIFMACKYRRTKVATPSGSSTAERALEMENQVYEVVDTDVVPNPPNRRYGNGRDEKEKFKKNISYGLQHK